jgi:formate hydrogenlyase subunit 6/NADH:ubiquinone oxidoreductase subunit I
MCEEACPVDAIELTTEYDIVGTLASGDGLRQGEAPAHPRLTIGKKPM